jgi:hypothetical protein
MTPAEHARDNALHCEMVLYAYRKNKDGVVVSFVVHPNDMPAALATAPIGARFISALVQIGDDELPVQQPAKERRPATLQPANPRPAGAKRDWRDIQPAAQAGIRCADPTFRAFLREVKKYGHCDEQDAAVVVRDICGVNSRVELGTNQKARVIWHQLDEQFQAWKALEHA